MECEPYRRYSVLGLAGSIFSVGIGGVFRCLTGKPSVIDLECVEQVRLFTFTTLKPAFTTTALYAVFLTYVIVAETRAPAAFETLALPRLGGIFVDYLIPLAIANLVVMKGVVAMTSDIASMRVSQELEALEVAGLNPMEMIFAPRAIALMIAAPALSIVGVYAGFVGAFAVASLVWAPQISSFVQLFSAGVSQLALTHTAIKMLFTAFVMAVISGHFGFSRMEREIAQVGRITTRAAVGAVLGITTVNLLFNLLDWVTPHVWWR
jgi:ABC-type transporter Mla maintaining outer membrane lipid asymmetry permease subunit MlaE